MMNTRIDRDHELLEPVTGAPPFVQTAALCLRAGPAGREVLMVTSRTTGRWVLPKGWPMKGRTLAAAALREAWEEAGVIGTVEDSPVGCYSYEKTRKQGPALPCRVEVFRVSVADLAPQWPEDRQRRREWMPLERAAGLVAEPSLRALLLRLA